MRRHWLARCAFALWLLFPWESEACPSAGALKARDFFSKQSKTLNPSPSKKPYVFVFLSPTCPCSVAHERRLEALHHQFPQYSFVGIVTSGSPPEATQAHFKQSSFPFPLLEDQDHKLANLFKAVKTPHAFVTSLDGRCLYQGAVDNQRTPSTQDQLTSAPDPYLEKALVALSQDQPVTPSLTKTLGCYIR